MTMEMKTNADTLRRRAWEHSGNQPILLPHYFGQPYKWVAHRQHFAGRHYFWRGQFVLSESQCRRVLWRACFWLDDKDDPFTIGLQPVFEEVIYGHANVAARWVGEIHAAVAYATEHRKMFVAAWLDEDDHGAAEQRQLFGRQSESLRVVTASLRDALKVEERKPCFLPDQFFFVRQVVE